MNPTQLKYRFYLFAGMVFLGFASLITLATPWGLTLTIPATYIMLLGGINVANQTWPERNYVKNYGVVGVIGNLLPFAVASLCLVGNSVFWAVTVFYFVAIPVTVVLASLHIGTEKMGPAVMKTATQTNLVTYVARWIGIIWFGLGGLLFLAGAITVWMAVIFAAAAGICYVTYVAHPDPVVPVYE